MDCDFLEMLDAKARRVVGWKCMHCGYEYRRPSDRPPRRNCPNAPSRGVGDTIAKLTRRLGIRSCRGCRRRQAQLNRLVPYDPPAAR